MSAAKLQVDGRALADEIRSAIEARLAQASEAVRGKIAPRLEEVSTLLSQLLILRLERPAGEEPSELERTLVARFRLLSSAAELSAVDALQDSLERTVASLVRGAFRFLLS